MEIIKHLHIFQTRVLSKLETFLKEHSSSSSFTTSQTLIHLQIRLDILDELLVSIFENQHILEFSLKSQANLQFCKSQTIILNQYNGLKELIISKMQELNTQEQSNHIMSYHSQVTQISESPKPDTKVDISHSKVQTSKNTHRSKQTELQGNNISVNCVRISTTLHHEDIPTHCKFCSSSNHTLFRCKQFRKTNDVSSRHQFLLKHFLCFNCLWPGHKSSSCPIKSSCFKCKKRHSTLLHSTKTRIKKPTETSSIKISSSCEQIKPVVSKPSDCKSKLATALVHVTDLFEQVHTIRAVLDPGSKISIVSEAMANLIGLTNHSEQTNDPLVHSYMNLELNSRTDQKSFTCKAFISKDISKIIPTTSFTYMHPELLKGITLADPFFETSTQIDVILGADSYSKIVKSTNLTNNSGQIIARASIFGWLPCKN